MNRKIAQGKQRFSEEKRSLADSLAELHKICMEEGYTLDIPSRDDRPNPFVDDESQAPLWPEPGE